MLLGWFLIWSGLPRSSIILLSRSQGGEDHGFERRKSSTQMFRYYKTGNDKSAEESILEVRCRASEISCLHVAAG